MSENVQKVRVVVGTVVSDKSKDTRVVLVERRVKHQQYSKIIKKTTKLHAHDAKNLSKHGDKVSIRAIPPKSKNKAWEVVEVLV